ncbi:MAG: chorismate mutase [Theionarchaea archaeon]|nr:chorismate mutase [Theionarchaea archaeon]
MTLQELRETIDKIDRQLLLLLEERMLVVDEIKTIKKEQGLPIEDPEREKKVKQKTSTVLSPSDIEQIFTVVMDIAKRRQQGGP